MRARRKRIDDLQVADFKEHPVWEYLAHDGPRSLYAVPVTELPITTGEFRMVGTRVTLANGEQPWAMLSGLHAQNPLATEQLLNISLDQGGTWFTLARYFDAWQDTGGLDALTTFLALSREEIFPIRYDLTGLVQGNDEVVKGEVRSEPRVRLSEDELLGLILNL